MVIAEVAVPSAYTGPVPEIPLLAATGEPPMKIAVPEVFATGVKILSNLISAFVDFSEQEETPEEFETLQVV